MSPKENAEFVACMEDILDIYEMPYNPEVPVVCMDEKPYQLLGETKEPLPMRPGDTQKTDSEYVRNGIYSIFVFVEPLGGVRHVSVRNWRTAVDWAEEIRYLVDDSYPDRDKIILVMDNLDTHALSSLYKAFPAPEARRIAKKLEIHYTLKHGRWLDIAEIELNVMTRQRLSRRIVDMVLLRQELTAWGSDRNEHTACIQWQFTTDNAKTKLVSLYPKFNVTVKNS
ncbi:MAG: IS630 family transposase [Lachnospiraceae bacterium]